MVFSTPRQIAALQWPTHGGCTFPFPPEQQAWVHAALWQPSEVPSIMIFQSKKSQQAVHSTAVVCRFPVVREMSDSSGYHLVLKGPRCRYRLLVKSVGKSNDEGFLLEPDDWLDMRIATISAFHRSMSPNNSFVGRQIFLPSPYQRHRLTLLLRILDCVISHAPQEVTVRKIAEQVVYPRSELGRAAEWKASSERRHTQRLYADALHMMETGYRSLLKGRFGRTSSKN
jgi:Uncharacterized conserved protein (DUF2285)